jgi:hypothetical protein
VIPTLNSLGMTVQIATAMKRLKLPVALRRKPIAGSSHVRPEIG